VLEAALENGWMPGERMSELQLAAQCNVSRTPIRKALQLLAQRGIVSADAQSGGYRLAQDPAQSLQLGSALPSSEEEQLSQAVTRDLAAGRIPVAQTVIGLQRRYGASRITVQNVLQRLLEAQVVERAPGQQWLLKPMVVGVEGLVHSDEFRLQFEPVALLSPGFRADPQALSTLRQGLDALVHMEESAFDVTLFERMELEFHRLIARSCGNPFIADALLNHQARRMHATQPATSIYRMQQSANELLQVLSQLERQQLELAADLLRVHLRQSSAQRPRMLGRGVPAMLRGMA
jgi:DNA-binding GntR family transcriptional regulator